MNMKPDCLRPGCGKVAESKGLCRSCYNRAARLVKKGMTTWASLERRKKAMPRQYGAITRWFLEI